MTTSLWGGYFQWAVPWFAPHVKDAHQILEGVLWYRSEITSAHDQDDFLLVALWSRGRGSKWHCWGGGGSSTEGSTIGLLTIAIVLPE